MKGKELQKMHCSVIRVFFIYQIVLFCGVLSEESETCGDLQRKIKSSENEIESLKLALEEYKLASGEIEDVSDECNISPTCSKCLREKPNPRCGWCTLRNRCNLEENCPAKDSAPDFWISGSDRCPKIRAVKPHILPSVTARKLEIIIPHLPDYDGTFICSFEVLGETLVTKGRKAERGITCFSPRTTWNIPVESNHMPVTLSVRTPNGPNFASTSNFTIFDCRRINSCTECASSPFPCSWCTSRNRCTHDANENCRNDIIVFSKSVTRPTIRHGPGYCSRIIPNAALDNEMLVPSGFKKRITVKVENIMMLQASSRFTCKVRGFPEVTGQLLGDVVYCDTMDLKVVDRQPVSNRSFSVFWGGGNEMDNPQNLHVAVYHCGLMASNCGECLDLPAKYNCGWCEETNTCTVRDNCVDAAWMDNKQTCTNPKILSFYPKSGLLTRQTNITIQGINLGKEFKDIDGVRLINEESEVISECTPYEDLYVRHSQIVCLLEVPESISEHNGTLQGFIEVKFSNDIVTISEEEYSFVDPSIIEFQPVKGMESGGTLLKIAGNNFDAGNKVEVFIGDIPCNIVSRDSFTIRCITSPIPSSTITNNPPSPRSSAVRVVFDGEERMSSSYFFYVQDPHIRSVKSESGLDGPAGTTSGGNLIIVEGANFDYVPNPYMYIIVDGIKYPGPCTVLSETRMECLSPRIPTEVLNFCGEERGYMAFDYVFRMGQVEEVQNVSLNRGLMKFRVYPDPYFMPFTEEGKIKIFKSDYITIKGRHLDSVFNENDITVLIGDEECTVTSLTHTQLTCRPPEMHGDANNLPEVSVRIRSTHEYFIGFLRYDKE